MLGLEGLFYAFSLLMLAALSFFGFQIFYYFPKIDIELLKARMFLNRPLMTRMWFTSVLSGGLFVCYEGVRVLAHYDVHPVFKMGVLQTFTIMAFLVPYLGLTYQWYRLIKMSVVKKKKEDKKL